MIAPLIALALKAGIPARFAKIAVIGTLIVLLVVGLGVAKCAYDRSVIKAHENERNAEIAKADRKADAKAAVERRADDARATAETQELKEAVNEAGNDAGARRRAYYECLAKLQAARARNQSPASC